MKYNKIILPKKLSDEINNLNSLGEYGWTIEWQDKAKLILNQLILLKDENEITQEEILYIIVLKKTTTISFEKWSSFLISSITV